MMPYSDIIRQLLIDLALVTTENSYVAFFPEEPDIALCVYDTDPRKDGRLMRSGEQIEHPGIQITIRGKAYVETWQFARDVALQLDSVRRVSVALTSEGAYLVHNVSRSSGVLSLGMETVGSKRRHFFTINATLTVSEEDEEPEPEFMRMTLGGDVRVTEEGDFRIYG